MVYDVIPRMFFMWQLNNYFSYNVAIDSECPHYNVYDRLRSLNSWYKSLESFSYVCHIGYVLNE